MSTNPHLLLISGASATGKSASLMNMEDPSGVIYLNCEAGKDLPFPAKFKQKIITDPNEIYAVFAAAESHPDVHTIVIDSLDFMMDMYETTTVLTASNTMKAWGSYAQFFKILMQQYVAASTKNVIFLAHTMNVLNEGDMVMETLVKVKGSLMNQGIEAYFNNVISTKKVPLTKIEGYKNPNLIITPDEELLGYKYVYQTRLTKDTVNERIRGPIGLWDTSETFIDNNLQNVLHKLHSYYQ